MDLLQNFRNKQIVRGQIQCPDELNIWLDHCEYVIHIEFDKSTKSTYKSKKRKKQINPNFRNAIENLNREQKVQFYLRIVHHLQNLSESKQQPPKTTEADMKPIQGQCECRSFNLKIWKLKRIRIDRNRHQIMVQNQKDNKIKSYDLRNYLLRKSKIKDKFTLVLQSINDKPHQKSRTVHIAFKDSETLRKWFNLIKEEVQVCEWLNVHEMYSQKKINLSLVTQSKASNHTNSSNKLASSQTSKSSKTQVNQSKSQDLSVNQIAQNKLFKAEEELQKDEKKINGNRKTFIDHLVNDDCANFQDFFQEIQNQTEHDIQSKKNLDFFHKLMPQYDLEDLTQLSGYETLINQDGRFQILQNIENSYRFKLIITYAELTYMAKQVFCLVSEPRIAKSINDNIEQQSIKTLLKSENSAIMYQTLKAYNKFYRPRDFIFVRHAFSHKGNFYLIDKSIDNINYPPFMTLVRGEISIVWGIMQNEKTKQLKLVGDFVMVNSGLLNNQQQSNLSLKYLNGFKMILKQEPDNQVQSTMFDINWNIDKKQINKKVEEIRVRRKTIQIQKEKLNQNSKPKNQSQDQKAQFSKKSSNYYNGETSSPEKHNSKQTQRKQINETNQVQMPQKVSKNMSAHQKIKSSEFQTELQVIRKLNNQGLVIVQKDYIKKKFTLKPVEKQPYKEMPKIKGHAIWKGEWLHDAKVGGIIFTNQKKIQDQKGVLKFILTKIGKNILSGKSVLNISLPVDIFAPESNLQRLMISMSYGPKLLENLSQASPIEKLKKTVAFGVSNSVLYLNMEKPFNPILGQTFQCWINGCPGYAEQISHHPPIGALMFLGRGYRITSQLQSKVQLHMNSGCGINDGVYKVLFEDGVQICFMTAGGEVSGLTYGDRKFNIVGKSYYWIVKQRIFVQINFEAGKKGFFSKQEKPCDFFQGKVYQVTAQFFNIFPKSKKREPNEKQRVKQLGKFQGVWNKYVKFNDQELINFDKHIPLTLQYQPNPLQSDANWRQDIQYRRLNKTTRAQAQKQRLQVFQRTDRKFRAKYHKH